MIDLYGMSSPNIRKVAILLEELGLAYRSIHVAVFRRAQFDPAFTSISPFGKVPVIVDRDAGDLTVFESGAILTYLAETYGDGAMLPKSGPARYAVLEWLTAQVAMVGPLLGQNNHFVLLPEEAGSYAANRYAEQARYIYRVLDTRLAAAPYLAGEAYSIADIATYPWGLYVPKHGLDWDDYPALKRWCDRIGARPAVIRADVAMSEFGARDHQDLVAASTAEIDSFFWRETTGPAADFSALA
jgi:GSH-dependent disulfide-bond oxidoreductase